MKFLNSVSTRAALSVVLAVHAGRAATPGLPAGDPQATPALSITILEGEGATNNLKQRAAREVMVRVDDENHKPVAGALVIFAAPNDGPGGTFLEELKTLQVTTDSRGIAVANGFRPNTASGPFQIRVTAMYRGQSATAVVDQSNVARSGRVSGKALAIVGAVAVAATVGGVLATRGGGNDNTGTTISPGTPTVGAPR
jgi:hypothetical protein